MKRPLLVPIAVLVACGGPTSPDSRGGAGTTSSATAGQCFRQARTSSDPDVAMAACEASHFPRWRDTCDRHDAGPGVGCLDPGIIQAIVRSGFGEPKACYEDGLARKRDLNGVITVKFVIDERGQVADVSDAGSDMADPKVVACVTAFFGKQRFPKPEGGKVTVVYPIIFNPGD